MARQEKKSDQQQAITLNNNLNTPWIDVTNMGLREDNIVFMRFCTNIPEGIFEQARILMSKKHAIQMVDSLCKSLDYYPIKNKN